MKRAARAGSARRTLLAGAICCAVGASVAGATSVRAQEAQEAQDAERATPDLEALRARWWEKSEEERRLLRERFELLRRLPLERRRELLERARAWRRVEEELRRAAPDAVRRDIDALDAEAGRARWRELARRRARELGRQRLDRLPPGLRWRLENAPAAERRLLLERFRRERDLRSQRAVIVMGRRAGLPPERIRALVNLPPERRLDAVLELRRRLHEAEEPPELFRRPPPWWAPGSLRRGPRPPDDGRRPDQR